MALNANHTFEDVGTTKCSIVEKNCKADRVAFLKSLLERNGFTVAVAPSPPAKAPAKPATEESVAAPPPPETFTVGVTDLSFNPVNAIYNRELSTPEGTLVTPDYWMQRVSKTSNEDWYWKK